MDFLVFQFVAVASCLFTGCHQEQSGSVFFTPSHQISIHIDKVLHESLFSRLNNLRSLNPSLYIRFSNFLNHFLQPCTGFVPLSPCLSCTEEPMNGHSLPDRSSAVLSRGEGSFSLTCHLHSSYCSPGLCWLSLLAHG